MTITLSQKNYWDLFQDWERSTASESDDFDITWKFPERLGQGYWREIQLREGVDLAIAHYQLHDSVVIHLPERVTRWSIASTLQEDVIKDKMMRSVLDNTLSLALG